MVEVSTVVEKITCKRWMLFDLSEECDLPRSVWFRKEPKDDDE